MLDISMRSAERLKSEVKEIEHDMMERKRKMDEEKQELENENLQALGRLRNLRSRSSSSTSTISRNTIVISVPVPRSLHIHSFLAERIYPTIKNILVRIQATTSLWRWVRKIGFVYKRTSKVVVLLDIPTFMVARARYFATIA